MFSVSSLTNSCHINTALVLSFIVFYCEFHRLPLLVSDPSGLCLLLLTSNRRISSSID